MMMKRFCSFLLISLFFTVTVCAQRGARDIFAEASAAYEAERAELARDLYQEVVDKHPRRRKLAPLALFNVALISYELEDFARARAGFQKILESDYDERQSVGGSIMDNPYANFRHQASNYLYRMALREEQYEDALTYFALADSVYPLQHFCGNAYAEEEIHLAVGYSQLYTQLGRGEEALPRLLQAAVPNGLAHSGPAVEELRRQLEGRSGIGAELDAALAAATLVEENSYSAKLIFTFLGEELAYTPYMNILEADIDLLEAARDKFKTTKFYLVIAEL